MVLKLAILDKRMLQNRKFSGAPPQSPLGGLQCPPDPQLLDSRFARNCSLALASLADARMKTAGSFKFPYFDPCCVKQIASQGSICRAINKKV